MRYIGFKISIVEEQSPFGIFLDSRKRAEIYCLEGNLINEKNVSVIRPNNYFGSVWDNGDIREMNLGILKGIGFKNNDMDFIMPIENLDLNELSKKTGIPKRDLEKIIS